MLAMIGGHYGDLTVSGMIGYVQRGSPNDWSGRIRKAIGDDPLKYRAAKPLRFGTLAIDTPDSIFTSYHQHGTPAKPRAITHTLLACA
jgi:hypothetical protein